MTAAINFQTTEQGTTGKNNNNNMEKGTMNHENHNINMATRISNAFRMDNISK